MKKLSILTFLLLSYSSVSAQQSFSFTPDQKEKLENQFKKDAQQLNLSKDVAKKYIDISMKFAHQLEALKNTDEPKLSKFNEFKSLRKSKDSQIKQLLSKSQYKTYASITKKRMQKMKQKRENQ